MHRSPCRKAKKRLPAKKVRVAGRDAAGSRRTVILKLFRALFWAAAAFAFVMAVLPQPVPVPGSPSDKVLHILAFACLALLGSAAYPRLAAWKLVLGLSGFGALIELVQLIPSLNRDAEALDLLADTAAAAAVVGAIDLWRRARGGPDRAG